MAALKCVSVCVRARALVTVKDAYAYYVTYMYARTIPQYKCGCHHRDHDRVRDFHACGFADTSTKSEIQRKNIYESVS